MALTAGGSTRLNEGDQNKPPQLRQESPLPDDSRFRQMDD